MLSRCCRAERRGGGGAPAPVRGRSLRHGDGQHARRPRQRRRRAGCLRREEGEEEVRVGEGGCSDGRYGEQTADDLFDAPLNGLFAEGETTGNRASFGEGVLEERVFTRRTEAGRLLSRRPSRRGDALRAQPDTYGALLQAIVTLSDRCSFRPTRPSTRRTLSRRHPSLDSPVAGETACLAWTIRCRSSPLSSVRSPAAWRHGSGRRGAVGLGQGRPVPRGKCPRRARGRRVRRQRCEGGRDRPRHGGARGKRREGEGRRAGHGDGRDVRAREHQVRRHELPPAAVQRRLRARPARLALDDVRRADPDQGRADLPRGERFQLPGGLLHPGPPGRQGDGHYHSRAPC